MDKGSYVDLADPAFMIAFGVRNVYGKTNIDSQDFVKWSVDMVEADGNNTEKRIPLGFHKCGENEFQRFYPPNEKSKKRIDSLKK